MDIIAKAERDKISTRRATHHIVRKDNGHQEEKPFKYSGGPIKSDAGEEESGEDVHKRSRMYMVGLNQFQKEGESILGRKKSMNHPLNSLKKKSLEDSEISASVANLEQSRNKSFNVGPYRKFTSKDIGSDQLDELEIEQEDYRKNYDDLMN